MNGASQRNLNRITTDDKQIFSNPNNNCMEPTINNSLSPESPDFEPLDSVFYDETETGWDGTCPTEAEGPE